MTNPDIDPGPRVEDEFGELWLTWEEVAMGGIVWEWKQRRLTFWERVAWRLFKHVPRVETV